MSQTPTDYIIRCPNISRRAGAGCSYDSRRRPPVSYTHLDVYKRQVTTLLECGLERQQIETFSVPGAFELTYTANLLSEVPQPYDAIIIIGCVIRGETSHYDLICNSVTEGATELNLRGKAPIIFGLVTVENIEQARARSGGAVGNKGSECAIAALQMIDIRAAIQG